ncbi:MAG: hypothetical protein PW735_02895 [Acidobacteriaceae bacterium]|nr:hypothetical protein [Acidobacteriaceae bacterium]
MRRVIFWGVVISGAVAAALMYKRGESLGTIAKDVSRRPVRSMVRELRSV